MLSIFLFQSVINTKLKTLETHRIWCRSIYSLNTRLWEKEEIEEKVGSVNYWYSNKSREYYNIPFLNSVSSYDNVSMHFQRNSEMITLALATATVALTALKE